MNIRKTFLLCTLMLFFAAAGSASAENFVQSYYKNNPLTVENLENMWGKPVSVKIYKDGFEKRIYGEKDAETGYTYFIVKAGYVVDRGNTQSIENDDNHVMKGPELSGWMVGYYKDKNRTVDQMMEMLGEPIHSSRYPNGMERIFFGPIEQDIYAYVIVLNGKVIDAGPTSKPTIVKSQPAAPHLSSFMTSWYKNHPKSEKNLIDKWGAPLNVVQYNNGLKKMIFGPKDSVTGYNYFIIKDGQVIDRGVTDSRS